MSENDLPNGAPPSSSEGGGPDPSAVTFAFGDVFPIIRRGMKGHVVTAEDMVPLAPHMEGKNILAKFDAMMVKTFIWRAPAKGCWISNHKNEKQKSTSSEVEETQPEDEETYTTFGSAEEVAVATAEARDRLRLYMTQGYSLTRLLVRLTLYDSGLATLLCLLRVAMTILKVWSLWTIVRIATKEAPYGQYSDVEQYVIALCLPLSAFIAAELQHNVYHISGRSAFICRAAVSALIFEKLRLLTPLHLGAAEVAAAPTASSAALSTEDEKAPAADGKASETGIDVEGATQTDSNDPTNNTASAYENDNNNKPDENRATPPDVSIAEAYVGVSSGKLINMVSSDANSVVEAFFSGPCTIGSLIDMALAVIWIGWVIGWATAALLGAILVMLLLQFWFGVRVGTNKAEVTAIMDKRLRALDEFLSGIQVVKFYAWEGNVRAMIGALRRSEAFLHIVGMVWKLLGLATIFFVGAIFSIVLFAVKLTYDESMGAADVFVAMALIGTASVGFAMTPRALTGIASSLASMDRIEGFLRMDVVSGLVPAAPVAEDAQKVEANADSACVEIDPTTEDSKEAPTSDDTAATTAAERRPFRIVGSFGWPGFAVKDVDLTCPEGSMTVLIGSVGSGKSTLLQAAMGVCPLITSSSNNSSSQSPKKSNSSGAGVHLPGRGTIAYVAQEAFIAEATVRENITFGKPYDEARYRAVLKACSLVTDLQQWGGDLVEVTGNTLSGGQRQRLSLARACYADADLYIIDDPISAVDASVGRHLLRHCFRGFLKEKTILLATHHPAPARIACQVVLMEHGASPRVCPMDAGTAALVEEELGEGNDNDYEEESPALMSPASEGGGATTAALLSASGLINAVRRIEAEDEARHPTVHNDDEGPNENCSGAFGPDPTTNGEEDSNINEKEKKTDEKKSNNVSEQQKGLEWDALLDALIGKSRELRHKELEVAGAVSLDVYKAYISGGGWGLCAATVLVFVAAQAVRSIQDWWFSAWTRRQFEELSNDQYLYILGIMVGVLIVLSFARTVIFGVFTIRASSALHDRMFEAIIASPLYFFEQVPLGRIMNRFSKDLDYCDDMLPRTLFDFLQNILTIAGALALLIYSVPWFGLAVPGAFIIFYLLIRAYMPASRYLKRVQGSSRSPTMNIFQATIEGLTTLRVHNRLDHYQSLFLSTMDVTTNALLHSSCTQRWMGVRMDWVACLWICVAAVLCIALQDDLGPSLVGLCLSQSLSLTDLMQFAVRMAAETENLMTSVERLDEYATLPPEENKGTLVPPSLSSSEGDLFASPFAIPIGRPNSPDAEDVDEKVEMVDSAPSSICLPSHHHIDMATNWPAGCDIVVKGLTMAYASNPTHNVLKDLHFTIKAGQRVAVVGRTGAGKSSLLAAFYRTTAIPNGSITIGGVPTTAMDVFALRSRLGIIPQVPTLFHGTIRYNLDPFGNHSDAEMLEALAKVRLLDYVSARQGLDTAVSDNGGNLSVGQRQLLCAARVLLTGASILFMDEATANIDEETDDKIQQIMREEAARRQMTIITIAHRLNTVMDYDLALVMSHGRLVEFGNPRALAAEEETEGGEVVMKAGGEPISTTSVCGGFTTNVHSADEVRQFAAMVKAMHETRAH